VPRLLARADKAIEQAHTLRCVCRLTGTRQTCLRPILTSALEAFHQVLAPVDWLECRAGVPRNSFGALCGPSFTRSQFQMLGCSGLQACIGKRKPLAKGGSGGGKGLGPEALQPGQCRSALRGHDARFWSVPGSKAVLQERVADLGRHASNGPNMAKPEGCEVKPVAALQPNRGFGLPKVVQKSCVKIWAFGLGSDL